MILYCLMMLEDMTFRQNGSGVQLIADFLFVMADDLVIHLEDLTLETVLLGVTG